MAIKDSHAIKFKPSSLCFLYFIIKKVLKQEFYNRETS